MRQTRRRPASRGDDPLSLVRCAGRPKWAARSAATPLASPVTRLLVAMLAAALGPLAAGAAPPVGVWASALSVNGQPAGPELFGPGIEAGSAEQSDSQSGSASPSQAGSRAAEPTGRETENARDQSKRDTDRVDADATHSSGSAGGQTSGRTDGSDSGSDTAAGADQSASSSAGPESRDMTVGNPLAPGMIKLMQQEIVAGLKTRRIEDRFARFRAYAGQCLDRTAGRFSGSELTGLCRLSWYNRLLRNPLTAVAEAEEYTRELHQAIVHEREGLARVLETARLKMDLPAREVRATRPANSPDEALEVVRDCLLQAQLDYCRALDPLKKSEIKELATHLYPVFAQQARVGHTVPNRAMGRRLCLLLEKMDRGSLHAAAEALLPLTDPALLSQLSAIPRPDAGQALVPGVEGKVARLIGTPCGSIVVGGEGTNTYHLDRMTDVSAVIDLGGKDTYVDGSVSQHRPVLIVIDLGGDDHYQATRPGTQGSGILGVSLLVDRAGNDTYRARDVAQGSCLGGAGMLIDMAGDDTYVGVRRVQAVALGGLGILIDRAGNDRYRGALWSQAIGNPLGFALLDDLDGNDHYYSGGMFPDSYEETPGYEGWGQGVGGGIRQVADGGLGMLFDGGGDDTYEYDYLSHGGGYWCGMGFARDFGGNDRRLGATKREYDGSPRRERDFQRFSNGYGCHYSLGFLFDDEGDDEYAGNIMCVGFAWDASVGYLCDFGGNDTYTGTQGNGAQAGFAVLFDYSGDDNYRGYRQGRASGGMTYHNLPEAGGNFGFVIDYGGTDKYGSGARNNSYLQRSSAGGFLIDRPERDKGHETAEKPATLTATGS